MDFSLTAEQQRLQDEIIRVSQQVLSEGAAERDREQRFSRVLWQRCGDLGLTGLPVPEAYGGSGLDPLTTALSLEAFGYGCRDSGLVFSVCAHLLACVVPIWKFGSEAQRQRWLPGLTGGALICANGMSEPGSGSDAFAMRTRAEPDGDGWVLNGTKMFISNGPVSDLALVFAVTDREKGYFGGITAFLVETGTPGFSSPGKLEKLGLRSSLLGELVLDDVRVGADAVLGGVGGGATVFTHSMDWERVCLFASHVGTMRRILEQARSYVRTRTQFGQPIGKFQAVAHKLADMKVQLEAARLLVYQAAWKLERSRDAALDAAVAKLFVSESLVRMAMDNVQVHGGYGFMAEYEAERMLRDAVGSTLYSGTSEMQRNIIARWLGL